MLGLHHTHNAKYFIKEFVKLGEKHQSSRVKTPARVFFPYILKTYKMETKYESTVNLSRYLGGKNKHKDT